MKKIILSTLLAGSFALAVPLSAQEGAASEAEYQTKLQELQATIKDLESQLNAVKDSRGELLDKLESNESEISDLLEKIDEIKSQLGSQEQALNELQNERKNLIAEQRSEKKHLAQQVRAAYQLGGQSNVKLLLNQNRPETLARMMKYHDYFVTAGSAKVATYVANIDRLNQIEPTIIQQQNALKLSQQKLQSRHADLKKAQAERKQTLAKLEATIKGKDAQLTQAQKDRASIERVLKKLSENISTNTTPRQYASTDTQFTSLRGKLPWPTKGKLANSFGSSRFAGKMKWEGVLISAQPGSAVNAVHHGRVVFADYLRGQGMLIILDHGQGYMSLYGHNQTLHKAVGSWVQAGEKIASVGNSGGQSQAGLYFEIRQNGEPTNPAKWCG